MASVNMTSPAYFSEWIARSQNEIFCGGVNVRKSYDENAPAIPNDPRSIIAVARESIHDVCAEKTHRN